MEFTTGQTLSKFASLTRSPLAQRLMELAAAGKRQTVVLELQSLEDPHRKTKSIRATMQRHGYRLFTRVEQSHQGRYVHLWASKEIKKTKISG